MEQGRVLVGEPEVELEVWGRYSGDWVRCRGDAGEMQGRSRGDRGAELELEPQQRREVEREVGVPLP